MSSQIIFGIEKTGVWGRSPQVAGVGVAGGARQTPPPMAPMVPPWSQMLTQGTLQSILNIGATMPENQHQIVSIACQALAPVIAAMTGQLHKCEVLFFKNIYLHEDIQGVTALHLSASYGHLKICELLMKGVREKLPKHQRGSTPLHEAAKRGYMKICELFMKNLEDKNL